LSENKAFSCKKKKCVPLFCKCNQTEYNYKILNTALLLLHSSHWNVPDWSNKGVTKNSKHNMSYRWENDRSCKGCFPVETFLNH